MQGFFKTKLNSASSSMKTHNPVGRKIKFADLRTKSFLIGIRKYKDKINVKLNFKHHGKCYVDPNDINKNTARSKRMSNRVKSLTNKKYRNLENWIKSMESPSESSSSDSESEYEKIECIDLTQDKPSKRGKKRKKPPPVNVKREGKRMKKEGKQDSAPFAQQLFSGNHLIAFSGRLYVPFNNPFPMQISSGPAPQLVPPAPQLVPPAPQLVPPAPGLAPAYVAPASIAPNLVNIPITNDISQSTLNLLNSMLNPQAPENNI